MLLLGLNMFHADASAAIIQNGKILEHGVEPSTPICVRETTAFA